MATTHHLKLPYIAQAQASKHITHNEALRMLDAVTQLAVLSKDAATPPTDPHDGDRYIIAGPASGAWAGGEDALAVYVDGDWSLFAPVEGWRAYVADVAALMVYDGAGWSPLGGAGTDEVVARLGVNATADDVNRLAVKSSAVLFDHADADVQVKLNRATQAQTASVLFQTGYQGGAEIGMISDSALSVKVSANGVDWDAPLTIDAATGRIGVQKAAPSARLDIATGFNNGVRLSAPNTYAELAHFDGGADGQSAIFDYNLFPGITDGGAEIRYFRSTNTTGAVGVRVLRGDGTAAANTYLGANSNSYLNAAVGDVGVGTSAPTAKLHVAGPVRIGAAVAAALPSASATGAGAMIYVPDAAGGPCVAFSDGAAWRRTDDGGLVQ